MDQLQLKSNSFIDFVTGNEFKGILDNFIKENNHEFELKNDDENSYILKVGDFLLAEDNLADFLSYVSENKKLSDNDLQYITAFYSYILKISDTVSEYPEGVIDVTELTKKTVTEILFIHKTEYTEFDLFDMGYPQKDDEGFYITKCDPYKTIEMGEKTFMQVESNGILKYVSDDGEIFKDLKGEYITEITNQIELDGGLTILNTINILGEKQILQYIHKADGLIKMDTEEAYSQKLKLLKMDIDTGNVIESSDIIDILINKSDKSDYDVLTYINENGIEDLDLQTFLKHLNPEVEITEYIEECKIEKIKRVIDIEGEIFCELDLIERNYGEYQEGEDATLIDEDDYDEQKRSVIMTTDGDLLQDINSNGNDLDLVTIYQKINIMGRIFILYVDEKNNIGLMDKDGNIVKITSEEKGEINLNFVEKLSLKLASEESVFYKVNNELVIEHDNLIEQLAQYKSF